MLDQLRGRNLAHVGCTIGLTLGLIVGLLVAILIIALVRANTAVTWATIAWFGAIAVLGALGYYLGGYTSRRLWGDKHAPESD